MEWDDEARAKGEPEVLDHDFIKQHTTGFESFADTVRAASWEAIETESGLPRTAIEQAASIPDLVIWAVIAMVVQFGAYGFARIVIPDLSRKIEEDRIPSAAMLAVIAVLSGTLAAASMTL